MEEKAESLISASNRADSRLSTMRAIFCTAGASDVNSFQHVLEMRHIEIPTCGSDDVLVEIHAAALNPIDYKMCLGYMSMVLSYPFKVGFDFSGIIVQKGKNCKKFNIGDSVYGMTRWQTTGALADFISIHQDHVALTPTGLSMKECASVPLAALTSYQSVYKAGQIQQQEQKVLVLGGSGGTGIFGVEFAKAVGCHVTATGSDEAFLRSIGVDKIINYRQQDWTKECINSEFDCIYDTVGGYDAWDAASSSSNRILKSSGHYCTIAGDESGPISIGRILRVAALRINRGFWGMAMLPTYHDMITDPSGDDLAKITELLQQRKIRTIIDSEYSFDDMSSVVAAFERMASKRAKGKIVIVIKK